MSEPVAPVGRKVRGKVICWDCETVEENLMAGYFLLSGRIEPGLRCERCGEELDPAAPSSTSRQQGGPDAG